MNIVFTFRPPRAIQADIQRKFPEESFSFYKDIKEANDVLQDAEILVTFGSDLTEDMIEQCQSLKWIMVASAGIEDMPLGAIQDRDIFVTTSRGIHKIPMAEFTLGLMLNHVKRFPELGVLEKAETWNKELPLQELAGKEAAILGTGAIGQEIARLCKAFRMTTAGINRSGRSVDEFDRIFQMSELEEAVKEADFVIAILPSTLDTVGALQPEHFEAMKQTAAFINIGRGDVVSEHVLLSAINDEEIAHAYLDVFAVEPLPEGHPFWRHENMTVTPHISSITKAYIPRAMAIFEHNLLCFKEGGDYQNILDIRKGY
ncbi:MULTISPECIES: D-2-hydroxyacid dehydrogenase [Bacillaceae]|uniref:3-phosphoglycerate dehydrogenase n=1 Tax=Domibacillus aminovorans TaxID=29332 RepID=A0A177KIS3_9BACI|nr:MULTISPECIES: D-2-hydroxyacid dehydrogenase [Bacillaceae]OAH53027.1 3-phosphoglycerate dehydrogenase [Domibacillus aminovorans]